MEISKINKELENLRQLFHEVPDILEKYVIFCKMKEYFISKSYKTFHVIRVLQSNYYDLSYSERKNILNAPSEAHLCKSIIMENTVYNESLAERYYPKYVCIVIQFITKINAEKVLKMLKNIQNEKSSVKLGRNRFHFRLVDEKENDELTGFRHHGVTPFLIKTSMPIILSERINKLSPKCMWLGGGDIDLKIRVGIDEFIEKYNNNDIFIGDVVYDD